MKRAFSISVGVLLAVIVVAAGLLGFWRVTGAKASVSCSPTGYSYGGTPMTAAVIATSATVTGSIYAVGCDIGVYYGPGINGTVSIAQISGAQYFGVVNNGDTVNITNSQIHDIGDNPLDGNQYGIGVYWVDGSKAKGTMTNNLLWNYQKGGIVIRGVGSKAIVKHNTVIGQGPINYNAANGIEFADGAKGMISNNIVSGNSYSGNTPYVASGILLVGGSCFGFALTIGVQIRHNIVLGNDVGIVAINLDGSSCISTLTPTHILIKNNIVSNDAITNTDGNNPGAYQVGITEEGDGDTIATNSVCGLGYDHSQAPPSDYMYYIDDAGSNSPNVSGNTSCLDGSPIAPDQGSSALHMKLYSRLRAFR